MLQSVFVDRRYHGLTNSGMNSNLWCWASNQKLWGRSCRRSHC